MTVNHIIQAKNERQANLSDSLAIQEDPEKFCSLQWLKYAEVLQELWSNLTLLNKKIEGTSFMYGPNGARFGIRVKRFIARHACEPKIVYYYNSGVVGSKDFEYLNRSDWESSFTKILASHLDD